MKKYLLLLLIGSFCIIFVASVQAQQTSKSDSINEIKKALKQVRLRQMQQQQKPYNYVRNLCPHGIR